MGRLRRRWAQQRAKGDSYNLSLSLPGPWRREGPAAGATTAERPPESAERAAQGSQRPADPALWSKAGGSTEPRNPPRSFERGPAGSSAARGQAPFPGLSTEQGPVSGGQIHPRLPPPQSSAWH